MSSSEEDINPCVDATEPTEDCSYTDEDDVEDLGVRQSELSTMPFEELMKLKEQLGSKVYKEAIFGVASTRREKKPSNFKRLNKNRPREQSSKKQVPFLDMTHATMPIESAVRDPRFDKNSGDYDANKFKQNYKFLRAIRVKEIKDLRKQLSTTTNEDERKQIKFAMLRLRNKNVEEKNWEMRQNILKEEKKEIQKAKEEGRNPHYATKKERRAKELVQKFNELNTSGKLAKHLEKKRKKNAAKDRKKFNFD